MAKGNKSGKDKVPAGAKVTRAPKVLKPESKEGRPLLYKVEYNAQAYKLCLLGMTDQELADFFEVDVRTVYQWKLDYPNFSQSIKEGREIADGEVTQALYKSAMGYEHQDMDIRVVDGEIRETPITKYYPPNATSLMFWLKNRQKGRWRDKHEVEQSGSVSIDLNLTPEKIKEISENLHKDI